MCVADRLQETHAGGSVVADDGYLGRPLARGALRQLHDDRHDIGGLLVGGRRGLEHIMEAAAGDSVGIGQRQPGELRALGHLGRGQGEGAQPAADPADQLRILAPACAAPRPSPSPPCPGCRTPAASAWRRPGPLSPPPAFTSSTAISAPMRSRIPWRAHGPVSGTSSAISTSFAACARAVPASAAAPLSASAVRRANSLCHCPVPPPCYQIASSPR